ncbi:hybrid sensor histidine kinase/response regulator [Anabaena subtropica]|uniref:histidine kinase n=1 Tax=Anabaena subtropica FACHB-260 TaxID=2692884 RepID=A0ABR8CNR1_9NOST|nr:hybrid sensor histidine kinase/response regulator [Anabaena subtropica]MBD2344830.1 hybrid sensor histidine kinase/response regulator [Anabaena subtropica FACHB-260]
MITDTEIREQGYVYFLAEAPDLIQTIEQELFSLDENHSTAKVHNLMRATHTIKGGAATVGLKTIRMIAHSLEDVFKALYSPDVVIDNELQTLLLEGYECLHLALNAELTGNIINEEEVLQRATTIFAKLQAKLGDAFGDDNHIPTSEELGFDIVQSIFEVGVQQRLESIAEAINSIEDNTELIDFLSSQAEVFIGLAESLNLPGFGEIAQISLAALQANPNQVRQISEIILADLQQAQKNILAGDRTHGGEPSAALKQLTLVAIDQPYEVINSQFLANQAEFYQFLTTSGNNKTECIKPTTAQLYLKVIHYIFGWFNHEIQIPESALNWDLLIINYEFENSVEYIETWLNNFLEFVRAQEDSKSLCLYRQGIILIILLAVVKFQYAVTKAAGNLLIIQSLQTKISLLAQEYKQHPPVTAQEKNWTDSPKLQKLLVFKDISTSTVNVNDGLLEAIWGGEANEDNTQIESPVEVDNVSESSTSLAISEQVTTDITETALDVVNEQIIDKVTNYQGKKNQKSSSVRVDVEGLQRINYLASELLIHQKRRTLNDEQVQDIIEQLLQRLNKHQETLNQLRDLPLQKQSLATQHTQSFASVNFDPLEMDAYTEFHLKLHEAIEETSQLQEATESIDFLLKQATQISNKKQSLAFSLIDNLVEARMLPLENILSRFPNMVKNLNSVYHKRVELKFSGTNVLIDKAIAEKLYDPLLHLVRNAFDHGIEPPQTRRELGKPEQGVIEICAYHQGSQTIIEVRDDGQGLQLDSIRKKALELNFIPANNESKVHLSQINDSELLEFMFAPGFTTAEKVSELSGRGMGLDIVRSQLQALNGSISVQTLPRQGTKFILKIPFSMTTDQLMLVQAGGVIYALLLDNIEKIVIPTTQQIKEFEGKRVLHWDTGNEDTMVSLHQLSELMYYNGSLFNNININNLLPDHHTEVMNHPVLMLRRNQGIFALQVDQIIGEQELVIRPLGNAIAPPKYVYGCSSLANGNLMLVIDGALLLESVEMQATLDIAALPTADSANQQVLPISASTIPSRPLLSAANSTNTSETHQKLAKVVLVVDDAISLRQTLSLTLQKSGYQVIQAQNGAEALEQLQRHPEIQLVVSDLEMPRMNGFEFLSHIQQNPNYIKIPIIILTSRSAEKHRQLAQELGAKAYFSKPYLEHELINTIEGLINSAKEDLNRLLTV